MATKYVTLKDSNGDTLYPQAVATNLAPGSIGTTEIADGAVTSAKIADGTIATADIANSAVTAAKIAPSVLYYRPGDSCNVGEANSGEYQTGRQRAQSGNKYIWTQVYLDKAIASNVSTITFTPSGYNEAFGDQGTIYSWNNPDSTKLTVACYKGRRPNIVMVIITIVDSGTSVSANHPCAVNMQGTLTFS